MVRLPPALRPLWPWAKRTYTAATRVVAPGSIRLSKAFGGQLPTGVADSADDAVRSQGTGDVFVVASAETITRPVPNGDPANLPRFAEKASSLVPRRAVVRLPEGRVLGPHHAVITGGGLLIHELSRYYGTWQPLEHPVFLKPFPGAPAEVDGSLGVLASRGDSNYFHFLTDVLPRLATAAECSEIEAPARWYVPMRTDFQRESLAMLGIAPAQVVDSDVVPHVRAEMLIAPTVPDLFHNVPPWVVSFLRERLLPPDWPGVPVSGRRLYVTRGSVPRTRRVINEDALLDALSRHDFEVIDPGSLSVAEQIKVFAQAETIVAPHGAALTNLAFASPGAIILELFGSGFTPGHYWKLASCVPGLEYRYLVGAGRADEDAQDVADDFTVDPGRVERILCDLWSRSP